MRRTPQEIVELVVFGLIALLLGTGVLWLLGAVFGLVGTVLGWLAALLWGIVSFLVPVALVAGAVVLIVRLVQGKPVPGVSARSDAPTVDAAPAAAEAEAASETDLDRDRAAESTAEGMPPAPPGTPPVAPEAPTDGTEPAPAEDAGASDEERRDEG
jgi:predicted lipid-binding transport protein (Tim44 family)